MSVQLAPADGVQLDNCGVLVLDQSPAFGEALALSLRQSGFEAVHGDIGDLDSYQNATVVLLDADRAPVAVAEAARTLRTRRGAPRIVLLLRHGRPHNDQLVRQVGAQGWVSRQRPLEELVTAVQSAHRGQRTTSSCDVAVRRDPEAQAMGRLTSRERDVLRLLATGLRNEAIGQALGISSHTARTHVQNVLTKLGVANRVAAVAVARRAGLFGSQRTGRLD